MYPAWLQFSVVPAQAGVILINTNFNAGDIVVPAQAGVILCRQIFNRVYNSGPRTGGGDPGTMDIFMQ